MLDALADPVTQVLKASPPLVWSAYATWTAYGAPGLDRELPLEARVSNEFEIVE